MGRLVFGGNVEQEWAVQERSDKVAPVYDEGRTLFALFAEDQITVGDRLRLSLGGRHDGEFGGDGFTTGRATAHYDLRETGTGLRASLGTGAKRPTAFQLSYNAGLETERSVGVKSSRRM